VRVGDFEVPSVKPGHVCVRVHAASLNPVDWKLAVGKNRWITGRKFPRVLGMDLAGVVETVGSGVTRFSVGDRVFGIGDFFYGGHGSFAEKVVTSARHLGQLPPSFTFEQGATLPVAGLTAWALRHSGAKAKGRVFINGASGGVGSFAVRIAKHYGAHVIANCSQKNLDYIKYLGADEALDYRHEEPTKHAPYDVLLDARGNLSGAFRPLLTPNGWFFSTEPSAGTIGRTLLTAVLPGKTFRFIFCNPRTRELEAFAAYLLEHQLEIPIERRINLDEVPAALIESQHGHARGKTVIVI